MGLAAGVAQLVEHFLAKEDVASSSLVTRSPFLRFILRNGWCGGVVADGLVSFEVEIDRHAGQGGKDDQAEDHGGEPQKFPAGQGIAAAAIGAISRNGMREAAMLALGHDKYCCIRGPRTTPQMIGRA